MNRTLLYLIGEPGAGKTTLVKAITDGYWGSHVMNNAPKRELYFDREGVVHLVQLGVSKPPFSGTDTLGMSVITQAVPWLAKPDASTVLCEGARLANKRFLRSALDEGYDVHLFLLDSPDAEAQRAQRAEEIGKAQSASWVKGARTRAINLYDAPPEGVVRHRGDRPTIEAEMRSVLGG